MFDIVILPKLFIFQHVLFALRKVENLFFYSRHILNICTYMLIYIADEAKKNVYSRTCVAQICLFCDGIYKKKYI